MKIGVIGAGTMGQGIAKAFAQVEGNTVALCDIKQEWAENGLAKIKKAIPSASSLPTPLLCPSPRSARVSAVLWSVCTSSTPQTA